MTGVSPVVTSDISSGYNTIKTISDDPEYNDLCGFTADELRDLLDRVADECGLFPDQADEAMETMRTFYNGYCFSSKQPSSFSKSWRDIASTRQGSWTATWPWAAIVSTSSRDCPMASDWSRIALAANETNQDQSIFVDRPADRFGVEDMLNTLRDDTFLASLLYYLGVLTLAGRDAQGRLRLPILGLVVRSLYAERLYDALVPEYEDRETRRAVADRFYAYADPEPLCGFIEQRFFKVFDNRDLRWSNELTVKTAFLTLLFNDTFYIMDSETAIDQGYSNLSLILRPDIHKYKLLGHLPEFKYLPWKALGTNSEAVRDMTREELRELPPVVDS